MGKVREASPKTSRKPRLPLLLSFAKKRLLRMKAQGIMVIVMKKQPGQEKTITKLDM
jgi:hypothetical protein